MSVKVLPLLLILVTALPLSQGGSTLVVEVDGIITEGLVQYLKEVTYRAQATGSNVVIVLNTDGGFVKATEEIVNLMKSSPVKFAVYVPPGGRAFSAGTFILLASDVAGMGSGSAVGAASPIPRDEKVVNALASWAASLAKDSGRNETAAEAMVRESLALSADEALKYKVIEYKAGSLREFLDKIGWSLGVEYSPSPTALLLMFITDPINAWVLILLGGILLLIGLTHPTFILEGVGASIALLGLYGMGIMGASLTAIILIVLGVATIFLELKTGHGLLALGGSVIASLGLLLVYEGSPLITLSVRAETVIVTLVFISGLVGFYLYKIRESLKGKSAIPLPKDMVGKEGVVKTKVTPQGGVVLIGSELWTAFSDEEIEEGARVRVVDVQGFKLKVERV